MMSFLGDDASKQQAELTPAKRALLEKRLQGKSAAASGSQLPAITPEPHKLHEPFPLTDIQQAYWVGRSGAFELGNVSTHVYLELENDRLDLSRFELAWQRLIERHGMLRAVVDSDGRQRVLAEVPPYRLGVLDLSESEEAQVEAELETIRERMSHQVLPSDRWPLFEVRASRLRGGRIRLHVSIDILICDGWSLQLVLHELSLFYNNPDASLPKLDLSFRDYVLAEAKVAETELYSRSKQYWQERLPDLPSAPELPVSADAESLVKPRFVRRSGRLEREEWLLLKSRATRLGLTPANVLATAFAEVLGVWSKSQRFTLNLTLFNRLPLHPQVNEIVGDFTSLNLLAVDFSHAEGFIARALRLNRQLWQDLSHRYYGGMQVMRDLTRMRGGSSNVTMPVVFTSLINIGISGQSNSMLSTLGEVVYSISQTPQVWLDHQVLEQGGALIFNWDAVADLFPPSLLDEMFSAYRLLLARLAANDSAWHAPTHPLLPQSQLAARAAANQTGDPAPPDLL
ncbi:MAG: condensation domain-containing protein, partial [Pyrinomonadaceae bacterium]